MSSPASRRSSCRGGASGNRASSECSARRRSSSCARSSSGAQTEDLSVSLSQPILAITLRFLLAIDLWLSKRLGVCACEESPWGGIRPLARLVEVSGHVIPWLAGTAYTLLRGQSAEEQEIMLNLALGERMSKSFCGYRRQLRLGFLPPTAEFISCFILSAIRFFRTLKSVYYCLNMQFKITIIIKKTPNTFTLLCFWHARM